MTIKLITHNNITQSVADWARQCRQPLPTFARWVREMGIQSAIAYSGMTSNQRKQYLRELRHQQAFVGSWDEDLPEFDPELELRNRLKSWQQMGMSQEEIRVKARML